MLQHDIVRNVCFLHYAFRYFQHRRRRIQQRNVHAKTRQPNRGRTRAAPDIERTRRVFGQGHGNKILHVGKGYVGAQPALGRLKVGGILFRPALETVAFGVGCHLHPTIVDLNRDEKFFSSSGLLIDGLSPAREQDSIWPRARSLDQAICLIGYNQFHSRATRLLD